MPVPWTAACFELELELPGVEEGGGEMEGGGILHAAGAHD